MGGADLKIMIQFFLSNYDIVFKCLSGKQRHFQKLQIIKVFLKSNNQKVREIVEALKNADFVKMKICNIFFFHIYKRKGCYYTQAEYWLHKFSKFWVRQGE